MGRLQYGLLLGALMLPACASAQARYDGRALPGEVRVDRVEVYKSRHVMEVWSGESLLKTYKVAIGRGPKGPKRYEGDNRTPEGEYRIDSRHRSRTFHLFLHVSYPNKRDRRAFRKGKKDGTIPANVRIGSAIGIHGEKKGREWLPHKLADWTQGCIAVDNDEIEELYRVVKEGAVLVIHP